MDWLRRVKWSAIATFAGPATALSITPKHNWTPMPITEKRLAEIKAISEDEIDLSDIPEQEETFFKNARLMVPTASAKKGTVKTPAQQFKQEP